MHARSAGHPPLLPLLAAATLCLPAATVPSEHLPPDADSDRPGGRVVVVSLDGLGQRLWEQDDAVGELRTLREIAERGVTADGVVQAYPPGTPGAHAALWTGAFGDVNGIVAAGNPRLPRAEHTAFERISGFDARALRAEPLWVAAARQGIRVAASQATQSYPFLPSVTAPGAARPPVLASGYGPAMLAGHRVLRASDLQESDPGAWTGLSRRSTLPLRAFRFEVAGTPVHAALVAEEEPERGYTAMYLATDPSGTVVRAGAEPLEDAAPDGRPLARHFSDGLPLRVGADGIPAAAFFRLFELDPAGEDFLLYHPSVHRLALHDGTDEAERSVERAIAAGAAFIGNGPSYLMRDGELGRQLHAGGDGTAERRYLEGVELVIRQSNRLSRWIVDTYAPELLLDYSPYPDEVDHWWYGLSHPAVESVSPEIRTAYRKLRRRAYAALDRRVELLDSIAGPEGTLVVVSDHGMTPVWKEIRVDAVLEQAGFLRRTESGKIDPSATRAMHLSYSVLLNTEDWRGGIVPIGRRGELLDEIEAALREVRDPETGEPVFVGLSRPEERADPLGRGGPAGGDLYFDLAPGFMPARQASEAAIGSLPVPRGWHGFLPTREDMLAVLIGRGAGLPATGSWPRLRAVDVAPLVAELLGIEPPADAVGRSPLLRGDLQLPSPTNSR